MPSVSVIIPAYRAEKFIVRTVTSLLTQTLSDWEAVIVSDDKFDYQNFLAKHDITDKRLRFGSTGKIGSGPSNARNIALDMAKSNIIATLDADDTFDKRKLAMMMPMAKKHGMVVSNIKVIDYEPGIELHGLQYTPHTRLIKYNELLAANICMNSNIVYKRTRTQIYWPQNIKYCEDIFFVSQIYDHYGKAFYFRHKLHNYQVHGESLCRTDDAIKGFTRDRNILISMLQEKESLIMDKSTKNMLIDFLQAGSNVNKKYNNKIISYEHYIRDIRSSCPFLPNHQSWK